MAEVFEVSRGGYYSWLRRGESERSRYQKLLLEKIKDLHRRYRVVYGSKRVHQALIEEGFCCSLKLVARLMRENDIRANSIKKYKGSSKKKGQVKVAVNVVDRDFEPSKPNEIWVSDITYIYTLEGWFYLCVIIDLFSRNVVGWSSGKNIDSELVVKALNAACQVRKPSEGLIFHSDRGCQYTSDKVRRELLERGFIRSMSRKGNCWDNAVAESFFHSSKVEEVYRKSYRTREEARRNIISYIEVFYNRQRMHSYQGYLTPAEFEAKRA